MLYKTPDTWREAKHKRVLLFGMSGLGKTHVSNMLRAGGHWYHYSIDYRIGTRYLGEHIVDNAKRHAMQVPFLRDLMLSDSLFIGSNISFNNLSPLSTYLGKPGDPDKGGLTFAEYQKRQDQHRDGEIAALLDTPHFIERAQDIYGYANFICDSGGSICEVVDPLDRADPVLSALSEALLLVWIEGNDAHTEELIHRFDADPKPMYYQPEFLRAAWSGFLAHTGQAENKVDPDAFMRWTYARAMAHRQPRYAAIAQHWGVKVPADAVANVQSDAEFDNLIASALEQRYNP